jgi:hypothetical protein
MKCIDNATFNGLILKEHKMQTNWQKTYKNNLEQTLEETKKM